MAVRSKSLTTMSAQIECQFLFLAFPAYEIFIALLEKIGEQSFDTIFARPTLLRLD